MDSNNTPVISVNNVSKDFLSNDGKKLKVLENVSLELQHGEIVAILGKSGSGKSTLLRTIAGLITPTSGVVKSNGVDLQGINKTVGMVFQSFALLPWLTIAANVELGLQARAVATKERKAKALAILDLIGLDGFESAYPKELSGGMRQRVGFARALVTEPAALLMDEPFSALDVLTAENLRTELMFLWEKADFPTKTICIVTHNIEEAILLADRVLVLGTNPGHIKSEVKINLPRPRKRNNLAFENYVDEIYSLLTGNEKTTSLNNSVKKNPFNTLLPEVNIGGLAGLLELIYAHDGEIELADLATELLFEVDDLLPLLDAASMLKMISLEAVTGKITQIGRAWHSADIQTSKEIFAKLALENVPLISTIYNTLKQTNEGKISNEFFLNLLHRNLSKEKAIAQLEIAIDWGRYAELFDYDSNGNKFFL